MCVCMHNTHACFNNFPKSNQGSSALKTSTLSITTQQRWIENNTTMSICVCYFLSIPHPQNIVKCMRKVGVSGITVDLTRETNSQRETTQSTIISFHFSGWGDGCDFVFHTREWNIDTGQFPHAWAVPGSPWCRSAILLLCEKGEPWVYCIFVMTGRNFCIT